MKFPLCGSLVLATMAVVASAWSPEPTPDTPANRQLENYFEQETARVEAEGGLGGVRDAAVWKARAPEYRRQLAEMLGLDPLPDRTPLEPVTTGTVAGDGFVVEKIRFQSLPGLHVTANLYRPATVTGRLPAIVYFCGHSKVERGGVSLGNKAGYSRHGVWFARHGYVCLIVDTVELGEIRGEHHGTYSKGRWWWWSRGYTPAGVEAWHGIRAIDYLESRADVDAKRIGATGRSGGGATSWWVAALDERVRAAAPTAGITDLRDHVVDDCVEGHCDCMYFNNTHHWDFSRVAALVAPRPLLICNTDKDPIFPIDGVYRLYRDVRRIYHLLDADANLGLQVAEGPHKDVQPLNTGAFHWFERHLKGADFMQVIDEGAKDLSDIESLRVLDTVPAGERNTSIDESFVPRPAPPPIPGDAEAWSLLRKRWVDALRDRTFSGWPQDAPLEVKAVGSVARDGLRMTAFDFESQAPHVLRLLLVHRDGLQLADAAGVELSVLDEPGWQDFVRGCPEGFRPLLGADEPVSAEAVGRLREDCAARPVVLAFFCPRGIGPSAWAGSDQAAIHRRRRYYLLGQTLDGMRVWDIRRAVQATRQAPGLADKPLTVRARGDMAADALYAMIFEPDIAALDLQAVPTTHDGAGARDAATVGPALLDVLKILDLPQAAALAADKSRVVIGTADPAAWEWATAALRNTGRDGRLTIRSPD